MHISVTNFGGTGDLLTVEIASDLLIRDLKAIIESESDFGIQANQMNLYHDGKKTNQSIELKVSSLLFSILGKLLQNDNQTLEQSNVKDYDLITCQQKLCRRDEN
jgi:hypothetical protein